MKKIFAGLLLASLLPAASFEAASIKPSESADSHSSSVKTDNGLLRMSNVSLRRMIIAAYGMPEAQISGIPKSMDDPRYEVVAKAANPKADDPELMMLLQSLLTERFKLTLHHESRTLSGYALIIAKGGIKATPSTEGVPSGTNSSRNRISAKSCPMSRLILKLSDLLTMPVIDVTEEKRSFDFDLQWVPDDMQSRPDAPSRPTLFTALQEQLGLKLESRKIPADVLVIDHAEPPSEN